MRHDHWLLSSALGASSMKSHINGAFETNPFSFPVVNPWATEKRFKLGLLFFELEPNT